MKRHGLLQKQSHSWRVLLNTGGLNALLSSVWNSLSMWKTTVSVTSCINSRNHPQHCTAWADSAQAWSNATARFSVWAEQLLLREQQGSPGITRQLFRFTKSGTLLQPFPLLWTGYHRHIVHTTTAPHAATWHKLPIYKKSVPSGKKLLILYNVNYQPTTEVQDTTIQRLQRI